MANERQASLTLSAQEVAELNKLRPGIGTALNQRLSTVAMRLQAASGKRGTVTTANDLNVQGNRVTDVAKAQADDHAVTLGDLKRWSTCKFISGVLEKCNDHANLVDEDIEDSSGSSASGPWAFSYDLFVFNNGTVNWVANELWAWEFTLSYTVVVSTITTRVSIVAAAGKKGNLGLYDASGAKLAETGLFAVDAVANVSKSIGTTLTLNPGTYFHAFTSDGAPQMLATAGLVPDVILNHSRVRIGQGANTVAAALPTSLGTLTAGTKQPVKILLE